MSEETTATALNLAAEMENLAALIARFEIAQKAQGRNAAPARKRA